jgi:hypothetical protein
MRFRRPQKSRRQFVAQLTEQNVGIQRGLLQVAVQFGSFVQMGFWARLWWVLTGRYDETKAVRTARTVEQEPKEQD